LDVIGILDETSYDMREFTLGDLNGFGETFGARGRQSTQDGATGSLSRVLIARIGQHVESPDTWEGCRLVPVHTVVDEFRRSSPCV
jgi:hypothetical protein